MSHHKYGRKKNPQRSEKLGEGERNKWANTGSEGVGIGNGFLTSKFFLPFLS